MHIFLRAIGFSKILTKAQEVRLLENMLLSPPHGGPQRERHEHTYAQLDCYIGRGMGVILHGYRKPEDGTFVLEHYYPYMEPLAVSIQDGGYIRRHSDKEAYAVLCEDYKLGSALIFYLTNSLEYRERNDEGQPCRFDSYSLTGLSVKGTVLLPIQKTERQIAKINANIANRNRMLEAARTGDEEAMENLTLDDINIYGQISRRMLHEDIYSIVDTCFMPTGVECDNYMVIGEILEVETLKNLWTDEKVYRLLIECNGMKLTIGIHSEDLLGEPLPGRRFKGDIWLQGQGHFAEE